MQVYDSPDERKERKVPNLGFEPRSILVVWA